MAFFDTKWYTITVSARQGEIVTYPEATAMESCFGDCQQQPVLIIRTKGGDRLVLNFNELIGYEIKGYHP